MLFQLRRSNIPKGDDRGNAVFRGERLFTFARRLLYSFAARLCLTMVLQTTNAASAVSGMARACSDDSQQQCVFALPWQLMNCHDAAARPHKVVLRRWQSSATFVRSSWIPQLQESQCGGHFNRADELRPDPWGRRLRYRGRSLSGDVRLLQRPCHTDG